MGPGAGVASLVGAASPGRRKFPLEFERSSFLLSVLGALPVLLFSRHDQNLLLLCCCCLRVRGVSVFSLFLCCPACERCVVFLRTFESLRGAKRPENVFRKRPGTAVNAPGRLVSPAKT